MERKVGSGEAKRLGTSRGNAEVLPQWDIRI
jgi:hypothetical protein